MLGGEENRFRGCTCRFEFGLSRLPSAHSVSGLVDGAAICVESCSCDVLFDLLSVGRTPLLFTPFGSSSDKFSTLLNLLKPSELPSSLLCPSIPLLLPIEWLLPAFECALSLLLRLPADTPLVRLEWLPFLNPRIWSSLCSASPVSTSVPFVYVKTPVSVLSCDFRGPSKDEFVLSERTRGRGGDSAMAEGIAVADDTGAECLWNVTSAV